MVRQIRRVSVPRAKTYRKLYDKFRGVDFASDPSEVADSRSPDGLNMISDRGGFPVKRFGWRVLSDVNNNIFQIKTPVNGIFVFSSGEMVAHGGDALYRFSKNSPPERLAGPGGATLTVTSAKSTAILFMGKLYILTGGEYLVYDGSFVRPVADGAYIPSTLIAAKPNGEGTKFQKINMLTVKRKNSFIGDGTSTQYRLDSKSITAVNEVTVNGSVVVNYTVNLAEGTVAFSSAPPVPSSVGSPNVEITFSKGHDDLQTVDACSIAAVYYNRIFFSGNPAYPNREYSCEVNDPAYIREDSYIDVGVDNAAIRGYLKIGDAMAIIKEDSPNATIYLHTAQLGTDDILFPVKQGISGAGSVSKYCFANLVDDPLFLTSSGILAVASQVVNQERTIRNRSSRVNRLLTAESNLQAAEAVVWNGYYMLCINGHAYVADSRQKTDYNNITGSFEYEWYYWDNIPARCPLNHEGEVFFGNSAGALCSFNTGAEFLDEKGEYVMESYSDGYRMGEASNVKVPIAARWTTPKSDDGSFMTYKTMTKRGCGLYLKSYISSSARVSIITDSDFGVEILETNMGIFDFGRIDFSRFTFNTLSSNVVPFNTKIKKYKTIQIKVENDRINEGFGIYSIERAFRYEKKVK